MRKVLSLILGYLSFMSRRGRCLFPIFISKTKIEDNVFLGRNVHIENCNIGSNSYIGNRCQFRNASIGKFCSIAQGVTLMRGRHPTTTFVSTSPLFYSNKSCLGKGLHIDDSFQEYKFTDKGFSLEIGNDVWIGANVTILDGVKIGDGAIIAACSCVIKDVPPYAIVGGVPAKIIKYRFDDYQISKLMRIQWWNYDIDQIRDMSTMFSNIDDYLNFMQITNEK